MKLSTFCDRCAEAGLVRSARRIHRYLEPVFGAIDFQGRRVLDIGGGKGMLSFYAAAVGNAAEVTCMEPVADGSESDAEDRFLAARATFDLEDCVQFSTDTIQSFDDPGQAFDLLLLHNSINHFDEQACITLLTDPASQAAYRDIAVRLAELCRPGGEIVICDCSCRNLLGSRGRRNPFAPTIEWHKHQAPETWAELLVEAGFENPRVAWSPFTWIPWPLTGLTRQRRIAWCLTSHFCLRMRRRSPEAC